MSVHIGNKIKQIAKQKGIRITEFAQRISTTRENVYNIFKRKTIDTGLLEKVCRVLDHDFFQYYGGQVVEQNKTLKEDVARLNQDNALLREMIELLKEKKKKKST